MNLQTGLRYNIGPVPEKSRFSDRGGHLAPLRLIRVKKMAKLNTFDISLNFTFFTKFHKGSNPTKKKGEKSKRRRGD